MARLRRTEITTRNFERLVDGSQYGGMHGLNSPLHNEQTQVRLAVCMLSTLVAVGAWRGGAGRDAHTVRDLHPAQRCLGVLFSFKGRRRARRESLRSRVEGVARLLTT